MTKVLAITGCMGSGKSTLIRQLEEMIPGSRALFEDHYQRMTHMTLDQLKDWKDRGMDIGELDLNGFDLAIREIRESSHLGHKNRRIKILILESQFGRVHPKLCDLVDYQLWIDTPLDLCLARKLLQIGTAELENPDGLSYMEHIHSWCEVYLHSTASLLRKQFEIVSVASDAVVVNDSSLAKLIEASLGVIQEQALACLGLDGNWLDP
ncbi:MAG: hypothetical protein RJB11_3408 [Planctomycetota bacterium]|jgi:uridine kinase